MAEARCVESVTIASPSVFGSASKTDAGRRFRGAPQEAPVAGSATKMPQVSVSGAVRC